MFRKLRNSIWKLVTSNLKEGMILPRWAYCIRVILFPFEYLRKFVTVNYDFMTDTWNIEGVRISGESLIDLANSSGKSYTFTRIGDRLLVENIISQHKQTILNVSPERSVLFLSPSYQMNRDQIIALKEQIKAANIVFSVVVLPVGSDFAVVQRQIDLPPVAQVQETE